MFLPRNTFEPSNPKVRGVFPNIRPLLETLPCWIFGSCIDDLLSFPTWQGLFRGGFPTNFTVDLMDASLFFTTVRLGSMTVMILHPQNLQNWRVFIPTFYPFRCRTGPSHLFGVPLRPSFPGWSSWPGVSFLAMSGFSDSRPRICFFLGLRPFGKSWSSLPRLFSKRFS